MSEVRSSIAELLRDPQDVVLARSILGTTSVEEIATRVEDYCRQQLGRRLRECHQFTQSVGAVFFLGLEDGSDVVLKFHPLGRTRLGMPSTLEHLGAFYAIQAALA